MAWLRRTTQHVNEDPSEGQTDVLLNYINTGSVWVTELVGQ